MTRIHASASLRIVLAALMLGLVSCQKGPAGESGRPAETAGAPKSAAPEPAKPGAQASTPQASADQDCTRGEPEPALAQRKEGPAPTFERRGKFEAIESLRLSDSVLLAIRHFGCTHFAENYEFTVQGDGHSATDTAYWLNKGAALLRELPARAIKAAQLQNMGRALKDNAVKPYSYGDPIRLSEVESVAVKVEPAPGGKVVAVLFQVTL